MWLGSSVRDRKPHCPGSSVPRSPRRHSARLWVEALEDRSLLSGTVALAPSDDSPLIGESVTWTATAVDVGVNPVYQFSAAPHGGTFHVVRDFSPSNRFAWTPMQEGAYDIRVNVKDGYQASETASAVVTDEVASRVTGSQAVVTPTANPLVALYSVPPSSARSVFVQFAVASDDPAWRNTDTRAVVPGKSSNIFIAGMLPNTTYEMRHVFSDDTGSVPLSFTTGSIPANLTIPAFTVQQPPGPESDPNQDMIFHQLIQGNPQAPSLVATDLSGLVTWYYDLSQSGFTLAKVGQSLVPGGTLLLNGVDRYTPIPTAPNVLREIDLAGNPVRETNLAAVNAQLAALGFEPVHAFHHDVQRLADGTTVALAYPERTIDVNGTPTHYVGEMVLVLDTNFQVKWAWDAFDHLDVHRGPVLGEVTQPGSPEPTGVVPLLPAVDWLHVNAVSLSPTDGNLILSVRHQDWVIKIDYENGAGDGHVIWRLGAGSDFTVNSADPNPWFSHQHNAHYIDDHTLILFDNGNTRQASDPAANSRGQVWTLDETTMTATLVLNADLGDYSFRLGSAQRLSNRNYSFMSGSQGDVPPPRQFGQTIEVLPDGTPSYVLKVASPEYRSYRVRTLYEGTDDALAGAPRKVESVVINDGSAQRSMVNRITVTFDGAAVLDPGAIELRRQDGTPIHFLLDVSVVGGRTAAVLSFAGPEFVGNSLADGNYTLTVRADRVHDRWGRELDGDGNGSAGGDRLVRVSRLFGDSDGDGDVDAEDRERFRSAFRTSACEPSYLWYFDFDGDGDVDGQDNGQFNRRFRRS
ncbi:Arylsulfotransferase (ASST) [Singulisphaera sp. GP187]|uniref:aryl-sulfate sulfotransferase n=1 Tax=Singulisphaera sp. GP187 TaxID=1882752 RepID=UPI000929121D|nr:aryl-sulfate sulfotransferase [Singulisphaera sp. GP187]SIO58313.1 Arylsulfotransferase (ASST) [Singulisphaera sp. GP187]